MGGLTKAESCRVVFKDLGSSYTSEYIYILQVILYFKFKCNHIQNKYIHSYSARQANNYYARQLYRKLPSQAGARPINKLPQSIKTCRIFYLSKTALGSYCCLDLCTLSSVYCSSPCDHGCVLQF